MNERQIREALDNNPRLLSELVNVLASHADLQGLDSDLLQDAMAHKIATTASNAFWKKIHRPISLVLATLALLGIGTSGYLYFSVDGRVDKRVDDRLGATLQEKIEKKLAPESELLAEAREAIMDTIKVTLTRKSELETTLEDLSKKIGELKDPSEAAGELLNAIEQNQNALSVFKQLAAYSGTNEGKETAESILTKIENIVTKIESIESQISTQTDKSTISSNTKTPYRSVYKKESVEFHGSPNRSDVAGSVKYDENSTEYQFFRIGTSRYWNGNTPRVPIELVGWVSRSKLGNANEGTAVLAVQSALKERTNLHFGASEGARVLASLSQGAVVNVVGGHSDLEWVKIQLSAWIAIHFDKSRTKLIDIASQVETKLD